MKACVLMKGRLVRVGNLVALPRAGNEISESALRLEFILRSSYKILQEEYLHAAGLSRLRSPKLRREVDSREGTARDRECLRHASVYIVARLNDVPSSPRRLGLGTTLDRVLELQLGWQHLMASKKYASEPSP